MNLAGEAARTRRDLYPRSRRLRFQSSPGLPATMPAPCSKGPSFLQEAVGPHFVFVSRSKGGHPLHRGLPREVSGVPLGESRSPVKPATIYLSGAERPCLLGVA